MSEKIPLPELVDKMFATLAELRYTEDYIYYLRLLSDKLMKYAEGVGAKYMTEELKNSFLHDIYGTRKKAAHDYAARCVEK